MHLSAKLKRMFGCRGHQYVPDINLIALQGTRMAKAKQIDYIMNPDVFKAHFKEEVDMDFGLDRKENIFRSILDYLYGLGITGFEPVDIRNLVVYAKIKTMQGSRMVNLQLSASICNEYLERLLVVGDHHERFAVERTGSGAYRLVPFSEDSIKGSITRMLRHYDSPISAVAANKALISTGHLEICRKGSKSAGYKVLTTKGLQYGDNIRNPEVPSQTMAYYSRGKFAELLEIIGRELAATN